MSWEPEMRKMEMGIDSVMEMMMYMALAKMEMVVLAEKEGMM